MGIMKRFTEFHIVQRFRMGVQTFRMGVQRSGIGEGVCC